MACRKTRKISKGVDKCGAILQMVQTIQLRPVLPVVRNGSIYAVTLSGKDKCGGGRMISPNFSPLLSELQKPSV